MSNTPVDLEDLSAQLRTDGVAFSMPPEAGDLEDYLEEAVQNVSKENTMGSFGFVGLDHSPIPIPGAGLNLRDIAKDLSSMSGIDTVMVRTPGGVAAVESTVLDQNKIQGNVKAVWENPDYVASVYQFSADIREDYVPWNPITLLLGLVVLIAMVSAALGAWRRVGSH